jgi:hypothetical protein
VPTRAKEWPATLQALLTKEQAAYTALRESSLALRRALIKGDTPEIKAEVTRHRALLATLRAVQAEGTMVCRGEGLLAEEQEYSLGRLAQAAGLENEPELCERMHATAKLAADAAREMTHNRQLVGRLSDWMAREFRILLEPLQPAAGLGALGARDTGTPAPALFDRRR